MNRFAVAMAVILLVPTLVASSENHSMTTGDLQQICLGSDEASKNACRFYILGVTQGVDLGMSIADGKTAGGRPCIPENIPGETLELAVKMKLGQDLMVFPADRNLEAAGFVAGVLVTTFRCSKSK